jgi:mannose-6-phosphate isomerase-like protein (cupin superfamily)
MGWTKTSRITEIEMNDQKEYPYTTNLNILFKPLELVDLNPLIAECKDQWFNQTLCKVNDSVVRLGIVQGEYHWHKHDQDDEFFYVVDGRLFIDLEDRTVELLPRQGFAVPKGITHRTRARERTVILMVEKVGIIPTGN